MSRKRNDAGQYADGIDPDTVIDVFDAREDLARPVTAGDVVDELGIARRTAHNKLNALVERGELETRKIGARGRVWWRAIPRDESGEFDADKLQGDPSTTLDDTDTEHAARADAGGDGTETPDKETNTKSDHAHAESDALAGRVRDYMEREYLPPETEHGRNAVIDVFQYLREHETAKTGELKDHLAPNYADQYATKKAMWESVYRYLEDIPGIDKAGRGKYAYAGDESVREEVST